MLLLFGLVPSAAAHFKLNLNIRIIHIAPNDDGLEVYLRLPMPYLVANLAGPEQSDGTREPAPYTSNAKVDGEFLHYVDFASLESDALGLGEFAVDGHLFSTESGRLSGTVKAVRVHTGDDQPPFATLDEAVASFAKSQTDLSNPPPFVGDTVVDVKIGYETDSSVNRYTLAGKLNPGLEGQEETANLIIDYGASEPRIYRIRGLLEEPVEISHSLWKAAYTFVVEGLRHILESYDHVLFVVCLVIGATALTTLAWRVTGFTIGHSITLCLGFFRFVPATPWFVPLVETAIALSIIAAALLAISDKGLPEHSRSGLWITLLVGLLHGLGFSFVLQEILGINSPNIWVSLLSFNVGVELGQLLIVLLLWPILFLIGRYKSQWYIVAKWLIALPCIAIAAFWTGERVIGLLGVV